MSDNNEFVDVLGIIVSSMTSALDGIRVATERPKSVELPFITVARYGGRPSRFPTYDNPVISARVYASSEAEAYALAQKYNKFMCDLVTNSHISSVRPNALALLSSAPNETVYQVTHSVVTI